MKKIQKISRILAVLQTLLIIALVYFGRSIVTGVMESMRGGGYTYAHIYLGVTCIAAPFLAAYYVYLLKHLEVYKVVFHILWVTLLGYVAQIIMVQPVEVTHIPLYGTLAALIFLARDTQPIWPAAAKALGLTACVAIVDELLQGLHPERYGDFHDFSLNTFSALIGLSIVVPLVVKHHERIAATK